MSSGLAEHDYNVELDKAVAERERQQSDIELIADEVAQIEPGSDMYEEMMFFRNYRKQILSVRVFIETIKHV